MSKLTKQQAICHEKAVNLLSQSNLSTEESIFILQNYREDARHINGQSGAFFTPLGLARDLAIHVPCQYKERVKVVDLCAGIGTLSYAALEGRSTCYNYPIDITCVEINPDYVEVGKKLVPEATWICGDALAPTLLEDLGQFDFAISNPPFGHIKSSYSNSYHHKFFEYMIIEAASQIAAGGAFIIPQMSAPFSYSGNTNRVWIEGGRAKKFEAATGIKLDFNIGVDTAYYKCDWHCPPPTCEIVCCEFEKKT